MKIEIESADDAGRTMFDVKVENKTSGPLGFDELLGLISALTMPYGRPCIQWLKTEDEHKASLVKLEDINTTIEQINRVE